MCGIAGIIKQSQVNEKDRLQIKKMVEALVHRGPNGSGFFENDQVEFGMRRLSIIDIEGADQPLWNKEKTIALIFNGEIYNYLELKQELIKSGHQFYTHGDGETIIHAYEEYGDGFISHLRGMFAFCLYDIENNIVLLARDRMGEKPLYIYQEKDFLCFSSEMKSIISLIPQNKRYINKDALYAYFHYQYIPEPETLILGIKKLKAGTLLKIDLKKWNFIEQDYWKFEDMNKSFGRPEVEIKKILTDIEKIIMRSDVPVGVSLSGGLDSSVVATLCASQSKEKLQAFTVGYPEKPNNDERDQARELAANLGLPFHEIEIKKKEVADNFDRMVYDLDDPIADIAAYGYWAVAKMAKENRVPVLLSGLGADELFWGYQWSIDSIILNKYKDGDILKRLILFGKLLQRWKRYVRKFPIQTLVQIWRSTFLPGTIFYEMMPGFFETAYRKKNIFMPQFLRSVNKDFTYSYRSLYDKQAPDIKASLLLRDFWLQSNCLALGDRLSMAHSIELRLPFLDYVLFEKVMSFRKQNPDSSLGQKYWFKKSVEDIIPTHIFERKKRGFTPPTSEWIETIIENRKEQLIGGVLVKKRILQESFIREALKHINRNKDFLYKLAVLESWLQSFQVSSIG